ncbi:MAG: hypothetical protein US11_C0009G0008 [Candidatus Roizmanbacteria bacterium GW2011_GWA2_36_23]|uniref:Uncharacterized protein n=1 Tax=Candidatus Roizmanbacteria bacterium GW2011_GWA2_36_23 TaxID=1618480 RepID=A0A0G0HBT9_9BACT|nr:MAG: hypothetical protein US11_C0009G0008 [Candidatus Roizmanbacteria bacterium GW2011_GWA2_36_23]
MNIKWNRSKILNMLPEIKPTMLPAFKSDITDSRPCYARRPPVDPRLCYISLGKLVLFGIKTVLVVPLIHDLMQPSSVEKWQAKAQAKTLAQLNPQGRWSEVEYRRRYEENYRDAVDQSAHGPKRENP